MKPLDHLSLSLWREHALAAERAYRDAVNCRELMRGRVVPRDLRRQLADDATLHSQVAAAHFERATQIRDRVH